jgi:hypothetical protein
VIINDGQKFTNDTQVTLSLCAPSAVDMMISNRADFIDAQWESYVETKTWTITLGSSYTDPAFVYAAFRDADGVILGDYSDDILYDPNPPVGEVSLPGEKELVWRARRQQKDAQNALPPLALVEQGAVLLQLSATDDLGGVTGVQISSDPAFTNAVWDVYAPVKSWLPADGDGVKHLFVRFQDAAGNVSQPITLPFTLDTHGPVGSVTLTPDVLGPATLSATLFLEAADGLTGVWDMRLGKDPALADATWQPYTTTVSWPVSMSEPGAGAVYAQFRDRAGNSSIVYSDTYHIDTTPPDVYVQVEAADSLTRTVHINAYDVLTDVALLSIGNSPTFLTDTFFTDVVTIPYTETLTWVFDERRVAWVRVADSVGNWSVPIPAFAQGGYWVYLPLLQSSSMGAARAAIVEPRRSVYLPTVHK